MTRLFVIIFLGFSSSIPAFVKAEEESTANRYNSVRVSVYSKKRGNIENDGYRTTFRLRLTAGVLKFRSLDELLDTNSERFKSLGLQPQFSVELPTRWSTVRFIPAVEVSMTRQFDIGQYLMAGGVTTAFRYRSNRADSLLTSVASLKYGTRYDEDGLNISDYLRLKLTGRLRRNLQWSMGEHTATITPFGSVSYYFDELEFGEKDDLSYSLDRQIEVGLTFGTLPRMRLWKIKVPELDLSFIYGDDFSGFKIRL